MRRGPRIVDGIADTYTATRGRCLTTESSCSRPSCRYFLPVEARRTRCALAFANVGTAFLEEVAAAFGVTRERIRQIEATALRKVRGRMPSFDVAAGDWQHASEPDDAA